MTTTRNRINRPYPAPGVLVLCAALGLLPATVRAQSAAGPGSAGPAASAGESGPAPPARAQQEYKRLVLSALHAYERGRFAQALRDFESAHALQPTARTLRTIGMAAYNLGDFPKAIASLGRAIEDTRRPLTPDQRRNAAQLIARASREVARIHLVLDPEPDVVRIDDRPPIMDNNGWLLLLPGDHELVAEKPGYRTVRVPVLAVAGRHLQVETRLQPERTATPAAPPSTTSRANGHARWSRTAGTVALVAGGTALVAAGLTAALAIDRRAELGRRCPMGLCPPEVHDTLDGYNRFKQLSTVTFYGGLFTGAVGVALLLLDADERPPPHAARTAGAEWVPHGIGVRGAL